MKKGKGSVAEVFTLDRVLFVILPGIGALLYKSFFVGAEIQRTYVTTPMLDSALISERSYAKSEHELMEKRFQNYSDKNHDDVDRKITQMKLDTVQSMAEMKSSIQIMGTKLDAIMETMRDNVRAKIKY